MHFGDSTRTTGLVEAGDLDEINIGSAKVEGAVDGWFRIDDSFIPKLRWKMGFNYNLLKYYLFIRSVIP